MLTKIENKELVTSIIMRPKAICKCKIGQDWYKCNFTVWFCPTDCYPDYMEVDDFVMREIDGKELNIEEATRILFEKLKELSPKYLRVENHIVGCKTHFDVDVIIE